jgi:DNA invertase Pin-like site-specific DNA recombinase
MTTKRRCAIYTRTSTEEGLAQDFNSLHAQAEACAAYVKSQAGEGWSAARTIYEDGGFSGGSLDRPALTGMLEAIRAGQIDVVVVYKVDRLTRSLADFAKIVEIMDKAGASFVSVTQSFNTTTSMGRLTLNVLLSFAQFEREVTGERIRDKFAASKAKGMWMGGQPPLGYDINDRALVVNEPEAETVRLIFRRALETASVHALAEELFERGILSKKTVSRKGVIRGGKKISRGALAEMLANPIYRGMITHKGTLYPGKHQRIVDEELWQAAQSLRADQRHKHSGRNASNAQLIGKVFDDRGNVMTPSSSRKGSLRYKYYVTQTRSHGRTGPAGSISRAPMIGVENAVVEEVAPLLARSLMLDGAERHQAFAATLRVEIGAADLVIALLPQALDLSALANLKPTRQVTRKGDRIVLRCPISFARPRNSTTLIRAGVAPTAPHIDRSLVRAVALARAWMKRLETGEIASIKALARSERLCVLHTAKLLPLAYLAPDLVGQILEGRQRRTLTLTALISEPLPLTWQAQRERFAAFA